MVNIMKNTNLPLLAASVFGGLIPAGGARAQIKEETGRKHPNIVVFITDQQQAGKLSYYGDRGLKTPTMDRIASSGYNFSGAYCAFPLSTPQRFSMFTGMYPSSINLRFNPGKDDRNMVDMDALERMRPDMLANVFNKAGYDTYYGGKAHLISREINEDPEFYGFKHIYATDRRNVLGPDAVEFLKHKTPQDKPFLMVVSYINPHDICEYDDYVDLQKLDEKTRLRKLDGISRVANYINRTTWYPEDWKDSDMCPPLPDNFKKMKGEPEGLPGKTSEYTDWQWRMHRYVYNRLVEEVDADMAPVYKALQDGGFLGNTYIIFISDHGDMDGSHHREHKSVPYQEAQKVPFIIAGPGVLEGMIDSRTTVNTGIDFLPTLCELAGINYCKDVYPGMSVKDVAMGRSAGLDRKYIFTEGANWFQVIEDGRYKLTIIEREGYPEILVDLKEDPGELENMVGDASYETIRKRLDSALKRELHRRGLMLMTDLDRY